MLISLILYQHFFSILMLLPPQFAGCADESLVSSCILNEEYSNRKPSISSSTTLANIGTLVDQGIEMIEGSQIKAGLRRLREALIRLENQENAINKGDSMVHIACLYYLSFALDYLEDEEELIINNWKLINLLERTINNLHKTKGENSIKLKNLYSNFLLFSAQILSAKNKNRESFSQAQKAHLTMIEIFQKSIQENCLSNFDNVSDQKIQFSKVISEKIIPRIKHILCEDKINDISESQAIKQIKRSMSAWKTNSQKNLQELKSQVQRFTKQISFNNEKRNILGVKSMRNIKKDKFKIVQYSSIKDLLALKTVHFNEMQSQQNILLEISENNFIVKIQSLLAAYYVMSDSLYKLQVQQNIEKHSELGRSGKNYQNKKGYQSELLLLKSIQIAFIYLKEHQKCLQFLISEYQLKYEGDMMNQILEEDSKLELSYSGRKINNQPADCRIQDQIPKNIYYKMNKPQKSIFHMKNKQKSLKNNECSQSSRKQLSQDKHKMLKSHKKYTKNTDTDASLAKYSKSMQKRNISSDKKQFWKKIKIQKSHKKEIFNTQPQKRNIFATQPQKRSIYFKGINNLKPNQH